jgi:hypothetical protein
VLLGALGLSLAGFVLFWASTAPALGVAGLIVLGLGNALHYPLAISIALAAANGQPDLAASRSAYAMAFAFGVAPFMLGGLADVSGVRWAFLLVAGDARDGRDTGAEAATRGGRRGAGTGARRTVIGS